MDFIVRFKLVTFFFYFIGTFDPVTARKEKLGKSQEVGIRSTHVL
jgi:hypothetical protein